MDLEQLSFVLSGKLRQHIVRLLDKPRTPSELAFALKTIEDKVRELELTVPVSIALQEAISLPMRFLEGNHHVVCCHEDSGVQATVE